MSEAKNYATIIKPIEAIIDISVDDDLSEAIDLFQCTPAGIEIPAGITSTSISFQQSSDGINFNDVYDETRSVISVDIIGGSYVTLRDIAAFYGIRFLKIKTGSAEAADRTFKIIPKVVT